MTATTPTWGIPYAVPTDPLCDGGQIIDSMADTLNTLLVDFNFDLDRVLTIPYASVQDTVTQTYNTNIAGFGSPALDVAYDTVLADTDDLTNLATLPLSINVPGTTNAYWFSLTDPQQWSAVAFPNDLMGTLVQAHNQTGGVTTVGTAGYATVLSNIMGVTVPGMLAIDNSAGDIEITTNVFAANTGQPVATVTSSYLAAMWVADE